MANDKNSLEGRKIYERLDNGIEIWDAEYFNQPLIDFAYKTKWAFIITGIIIFFIITILWIIPYLLHLACNLPYITINWNWR